jgi:hypothetical protein
MEISFGLPGRSARQCRERWSDYLNPEIRIEPWTQDEDTFLLQQVGVFGHRWTAIAVGFARRSANDVKNRWYSHLRFCSVVASGGSANGGMISGEIRIAEIAKTRTSRVWLPQLCSDDWQRLELGDLVQTK